MSLFAPAPEPASELARYRFLGPSCGLRVSPFALGAMSIGEAWSDFMGSMPKSNSFKLLDRFYELGGNFIDTANNYQNEESETIIGEWMAQHKNRDEMVIATKYTTGFKQADPNAKIKVNYQGNHQKSMRVSVEHSLKKLQTDYIDILFVHWWDYTTSIEEVMQGLATLVRQGKVLYLGVSDTPAWIVSAANEYAKAHALPQFVVYQGKYSLLERDLERDIIPMCRHYGMGLVTWNSMLGGKLQSKAQIEERKKSGEGLRNILGGAEQTPEQVKASEVVEKVANELGTSLTAVALAYVMRKYAYLLPLVGGRKVEHLEQNIEALSISLSDQQVRLIEDTLDNFDIGFPSNFIGESPFNNGGEANFLMKSIAKYVYPQNEQPVDPSKFKKSQKL